MANRLIDMAVETSDFGQELIRMEDAAEARALLEVGGGGGGNVLSVNGQVGVVELGYADVGAASAAQGALAETALQPGDAPGAITSVNGQTGVVVLDYFDVGAASEEQGALAETALQPGEAATLAQGAKADTAVQPGMLAAVATSGSYTDLSNRPTLGTASAQPVSAFASAAQGVKADSAVQPGSLGTAAFQPSTAFATAAQGAKADTAVQPNVPNFTENMLVSRTNTMGLEHTLRVTGANAPVIHYEYRYEVGDGRPLNGQLIGAAGARPWAGSDWTEHSAVAYHMGASENHTATAQGTFFNILVTPYTQLSANRFVHTTFNADGDIVNSRGLTHRMVNASERTRGMQVLRQANSEYSVASYGNAAFVAFFRGIVAGGTPSATTATAAGAGTGLGFTGFDGTNFTGARGIVGVLAAEAYTASAQGTEIVFETTPIGSLARTRRLRIMAGGGVWIANSASPADTPAGGGYLYVEGGALKYKGSSGTVTTIAPA